ncbi:GNAT family N-acetyltransferase (plasmid) [Kitasatospora sp. NBC_00374]|uniref:GNAT family N-acetyltransferase n=1 Tax=Kitasatospora sp. NBC_00374 TaxID=2975964 RepID=UPI002F914EA1
MTSDSRSPAAAHPAASAGQAVEFFGPQPLVLVETAPPQVSAADRLAVDRIWARDAAANPALFDGPVIVCTGLEQQPGRLVLSWAPLSYRYRALRQLPGTPWKPAAVFVTVLQPVTGGGLVVGRESASTAHPGRWQLPGGSVEPPPDGQQLDFEALRRHAARELAEEIGLESDPDSLRLWAVSRGEHSNIGVHLAAKPVPEGLVRRCHQALLTSMASSAEPELEAIATVDSPTRLAALGPTVDYLHPVLARWADPAQASDRWQPSVWPATLATSRLHLRPVETADAELLSTLWSDPGVRRYLGGPVPLDRIARRLEQAPGHPGHFTVTLHGAPIGRVTVDQDHRTADRTEVSYEFLPSAGGRGLAAEAVAEVIRWVRTTDPERELVAVTQAANRRSRRLLEALGLSADRRLDEHGVEQAVYVLAPGESPAAPGQGLPS